MVYWDYIGILEKKMEPTIVYWGHNRDSGKENGSYYSVKNSDLPGVCEPVAEAQGCQSLDESGSGPLPGSFV